MALYHGHLVHVANIGDLWSLCVEEQFYLIWPFIIWFVRDRKKLMRVCIAMVAFTILLRSFVRLYLFLKYRSMGFPGFLFHWSTPFRCDTLLIGAWFALYLRGVKLSTLQLRKMSTTLILLPAAVLTVGSIISNRLFPRTSYIFGPFLISIGYTLIALICAGIILRSIDESTLLSRVLRFKPLHALGIISYGFYFFHGLPQDLLTFFASTHGWAVPYIPPFAFLATVGFATLSFHYYESPFLKLKSRLAPGHRSVPSGKEQIDLVA